MTADAATTRSDRRWALRSVAIVIGVAAVLATAWTIRLASQLTVTRIVFAVVVMTYLAVGVLIVERRRGNREGIVVFALGVFFGLYLVLDAAIANAASVTGADVLAWATGLMDAPMFISVGLLFLLFPDGHLPSPRWRWLLGVDVAVGVVVVAWSASTPGPLTYYPQFDNPLGSASAPLATVGPIAYMLLVVSVGLSALSLIGRWRRGGPVERAQLKWVASAALLVALAMTSYGLAIGPGRFDQFFDLLVGVTLGFFPVAIGIAILRYRLYEIDRLVSRTIAYAIVTGGLVVVYLVVNLALTTVLGSLVRVDTVAVAASTLVVAALFTPVRRRVQAVVDHRFDRSRYDAERTTLAFAERLRDQVDLPAVAADLDDTIRAAIAPRSVSLWLRAGTHR